jgi:hypothetical protein
MALKGTQTNSQGQSGEAVKAMLTDLAHVRREVSKEYRWFMWLGLSTTKSKRRRMLFLFVKDLSSGVSGEALSSKSERDSSLKTKTLSGVSSWKLISGWVFIVLMNGGLLFYVFLFALRQTHSRQSAWFISFLMWLLFEVTVSSTGLVVLTHLLLPLFVLADLSKIKERVLKVLLSFRENYLRDSRDLEAGMGRTNPVPEQGQGQRQGQVEISERVGGKGEMEEEESVKEFNAAKYLFASYRVASLFPELPESRMILQFSTPWPQKKFEVKEGAVATEYDQSIILTALSRIFLYFLGSLLRFHTLVQDMIVQTLCNSGLGVLGVWMIRLYAIHPALPVAVVVGLMLFFSLLWRVSEWRAKLSSSVAVVPEQLPDHGRIAVSRSGSGSGDVAPTLAGSGSGDHSETALVPPPRQGEVAKEDGVVESPRLIVLHETERRERREGNQQQLSRVSLILTPCEGESERRGQESEEEEKVSIGGAEEEDEDCHLSSMGEGDSRSDRMERNADNSDPRPPEGVQSETSMRS